MTYGLWLSTAGLQTNEYRQAILANNLANANTTGFKQDLAVIQERNVESRVKGNNGRFANPVLDGLTGGAWVRPTVHTFERGDFERTGNPLDVAIDGDGFLSVSDGNETRFTRDGRLTTNRNGDLVLVAGEGRWRVLDRNAQPIRIDTQNGGKISITEDGSVRQDDASVGRLGVVDFADKTQLSKSGSNLYRNHGDVPVQSSSRIRSEHLELSTVNPVNGLAGMIEVSRAYQLNASLITLQDQTIGMAVSTVGRIG